MSKPEADKVFWCPSCGHAYHQSKGLFAIARRDSCQRNIGLVSVETWREEAVGKDLNLTPAGRTALSARQGGEP